MTFCMICDWEGRAKVVCYLASWYGFVTDEKNMLESIKLSSKYWIYLRIVEFQKTIA